MTDTENPPRATHHDATALCRTTSGAVAEPIEAA